MKARIHLIPGAGGLLLHVRDVGPESAPPILLIHGWSQHSLCWSKQMEGSLARDFRLIVPDLRGHGGSEKPDDPALYRNSRLWAGDIDAILAALGLHRPLAVGWSMGGWVLSDYLRHHGDAALAGIVMVGSAARTGACADPEVLARRRPDARAEGMYSTDQAVALAATIAFVRACVSAPLSKQDLAMMVGYNMLCPPAIRKAARTRDEDYRPDLARVTRPALVVQGAEDRVCLREMAEDLAAAIPTARMSLYKGVGHAPFWEAAERFDAEIAEFARAAGAGEGAP